MSKVVEGEQKRNNILWEELNSEPRHNVIYPAESVVRFVKKNFSEGAKILDDGCGTGRHVEFMAREGYTPYAIDITKSGIDITKARTKPYVPSDYFADGRITTGCCNHLPFADNFFDGVISYGVLYYLDEFEIKEAIGEIHRVLKPNGKAMLHVRTVDDYRFDRSKLINDSYNQCYIDEGDTSKSANKESGMTMYFFDRNKIECWCRMFNQVSINTERIGHDDDKYADVNYIIELVK